MESWGICHGMNRHTFEAVMKEHKARFGVQRKRDLTAEQMREVGRAFRDILSDADFVPPEDYCEQLLQAIWLAFRSWNSHRAKAYRDIMGISDDWGTAVIVQDMVCGNLHGQAGSGVVFTHSPENSLDRVNLWGDYICCGQGEDVVSGLARTHSVSVAQKDRQGRSRDDALEETFPEIFRALQGVAEELVYGRRWGAQEIEFTFEGPAEDQLHILQSRDMVIHRMKGQPSFVPGSRLKPALLTKGIGVSGGALCGRVVFSLDDIRRWRDRERETPLVLIRCDTVPDDIREISEADGLLTARGGATSHASIIAHQLGKTCVVGCADLVIEEQQGCGRITGKSLRCGDFLSMDGLSGFVYEGRHEIGPAGGE
jgi:pyruvate,orthophosphate dikinase